MANLTELLPCPFCGAKARLSFRKDESLWSHNIVTWSSVTCSECDSAQISACEDEDGSDAVAAWNTRPASPRPEPTPDETWFGCFTGDCPHATQAECNDAIRVEFVAMLRELEGYRARSTPVRDEPAEPSVETPIHCPACWARATVFLRDAECTRCQWIGSADALVARRSSGVRDESAETRDALELIHNRAKHDASWVESPDAKRRFEEIVRIAERAIAARTALLRPESEQPNGPGA